MLNFALSSIPKEGKDAHLISPAFEATILIRNDNLSSEEYETKIVNISEISQMWNKL